MKSSIPEKEPFVCVCLHMNICVCSHAYIVMSFPEMCCVYDVSPKTGGSAIIMLPLRCLRDAELQRNVSHMPSLIISCPLTTFCLSYVNSYRLDCFFFFHKLCLLWNSTGAYIFETKVTCVNLWQIFYVSDWFLLSVTNFLCIWLVSTNAGKVTKIYFGSWVCSKNVGICYW